MFYKFITLILFIIVFMAMFLFVYANAAEQYPGQYDNVDQKTREWFQRLRNNKTGEMCCNVSDCFQSEMIYENDIYYALLPNGLKLKIPPEAIIEEFEQSNPTGKAIVCYQTLPDPEGQQEYRVRCFVRGAWS